MQTCPDCGRELEWYDGMSIPACLWCWEAKQLEGLGIADSDDDHQGGVDDGDDPFPN